MRTWGLALLVGIAGCATTQARSAQRFTGYPYDITSTGDRISGLVCGVNVEYSVSHRAGQTDVNGFGGRSVFIQVRDNGPERHITGSLGGSVARGQLDVTLTPTRLVGRAGIRDLDLVAAGDSYRGRYEVRNEIGSAPMVVEGRSALLDLPPAALGALVPAMLNCEGPVGRPVMHGPVAIRFGGPPGYETRAANELR
jgi:hypothetical protein